MTLEILEHKYKEFTNAVEELCDLAEKEHLCPHCVVNNIIEVAEPIKESFDNLNLIAERKKQALIDALKAFKPTLAKE